MSQTKAQLLDNIKDNVQLDARNSLRFADTDSSHYVAFKAPATVSSNVTWTLPAADGSANYVLATDGSGTLSWIADPAGQWTTSGSNIYFTGGNVGIGDTSPSNPLSVTGASAFNGDVTFTGASYNVTWDKSADDLIFNDNAQAAFGTSSDLTIFHDGSNSYIKDVGTGNLLIDQSTANVLYLRSDDLRLSSYTGTETYIDCNVNGAVELYYDNSKKLSTDSNGVKINSSSLYIDSDNEFVAIGAGDDLKLKHNGSNSYITNTTGALLLRSDTITFESAAGDETYIDCNDDGAVEFYYDGVKTCYTGTNSLKFDDDKKAIFGGNLEIYHSSNVNTINLTGKELQILGGASNNKKIFVANTSNAAELYHDNTKRFETTSAGCDFTLAEGEVDIYSTGSGSKHTLRLLNSDASADNEIGIYFGPANNVAGASIKGIAESDFSSTANRDGGLHFSTRSNGNWVDAMRIISSGNVGIGTTSPETTLSVDGGVAISSNNVTVSPSGFDLKIRSNTCKLGLHTDNASDLPTLEFGIGNTNGGKITTSGNGALQICPNNTEEARFLSGGGLTFNGDTAAENALDDYERGTWTPECRIETRPASDSPIDGVEGAYTKVGRLVTCHGKFVLNGTPSEINTGRAIELRGFPFDHNYDWDKVSGDIRVTGHNLSSTYGDNIYFVIRMLSGLQYARIELIEQDYAGTRNASPVMQDEMQVLFTFTYVTT